MENEDIIFVLIEGASRNPCLLCRFRQADSMSPGSFGQIFVLILSAAHTPSARSLPSYMADRSTEGLDISFQHISVADTLADPQCRGVHEQDMKNLFAENRLVQGHRTVFEHTVDGGKTYRLMASDENDGEESRGTMRTLGLESALYTAIKGDSFLTIDEIETSLHPKLLEMILFEYLRAESKSQLIVTTHNDGLLDLVGDLLRKDSVWFTEKNGAGVTDLYKLTDFRGVNRLSSIREAYRNKRFGATMN